MRTIKFQLVFDTAIGKYITKQSYTIEDFLNFRYGLDCLLEKETENFAMHDHDAFFSYEPEFIAKRQFTGLLDKNSVEIYEYMELDNQFEVSFSHGSYILTNISNGDIMTLHKYIKDKNGQVKITREYTKI